MARMIAALVVVALVATAASAKMSVLGELDCSAKCTPAQCALQKCDTSVPYACVNGTAAGGCATSPSHFDNTTSCTSCCDISSCAITCDACDAKQCAASVCTSAVPFMCTSGADKKGCAANQSSWSTNPGCQSCCDTSKCTTPAPSTTKCNKPCGDLCHSAKRCPFSTPYMCTAGNATDGCSSSKTAWDGPQCTDCCDVTLCPKKACGTCSASLCKSTQCSQTNPYICTSGTLKGGCSPSKNYWPESPDCESCCNFDNCPGQ